MFFRKHRDLGIDYFIDHGYEVELWSTYKIKYRNKALQIPLDAREDVYYPDSIISMFRRLIKQKSKNTLLFITTAKYDAGIEDWVRIIWGWKNGYYCDLVYEVTPLRMNKGMAGEKQHISFRKKINQKYNSARGLLCQYLLTHRCHLAYCFGISTAHAKLALTKWVQERFVPVHAKDYDEYILGMRENKQVTDKHLVFVAGGIVDAEDFRKNKMRRVKVYPDDSIYYQEMRELFDKLEAHYGMEVVIAAHPKSEYRGDEFGKRKIVYYKTMDLVREAKLIVMHPSASINWVIMYQKPFILVADSYMRRSVIWDYLFESLLEALPISLYNIDDNIGDAWNYINEYNDGFLPYYKTYIKEVDDEGKLFYEIVEEYIRKL